MGHTKIVKAELGYSRQELSVCGLTFVVTLFLRELIFHLCVLGGQSSCRGGGAYISFFKEKETKAYACHAPLLVCVLLVIPLVLVVLLFPSYPTASYSLLAQMRVLVRVLSQVECCFVTSSV